MTECYSFLFQIQLKYCIFCLISWLISSSDGLLTSENVIFQKTNEIYTNNAQWYVTFVHDLKPYQGFVNKIKHDIDGTSQIVRAVKDYYSRVKLMGYAETFKS